MAVSKKAPTFVLVHGAWADGTSWHKVIDVLEASGTKAIAAPIPLTSVSDDVRALDRCLTRIEGPVVLAAHAYAGAVISGSRNERRGSQRRVDTDPGLLARPIASEPKSASCFPHA